MTTAGITHQLAAHVAGLRAQDFSAATLTAFERAVLDWAGCTVAGARDAAALHASVGSTGVQGEATLLGTPLRGSAAMAAFHNAYACHLLEFDDLHGASIYHPGAPTISAAFAVAQRMNASAREFTAAVVGGYELGIRVGEAAGTDHYARFHTTGTVGALGAAAAAARVMGLGATATRDAIATAATQAAGLWAFADDGAQSKPVHPAHAALVGVVSADVARAGVTGAARAIEGPGGFFETLGGDPAAPCLTETLGEAAPRIEMTTFKAYPCCGHTHTGIEAAAGIAHRLAAEGLSAADIADVTIRTYASAVKVAGVRAPQDGAQAAFSYTHAVAWTLIHASPDGAFETAALEDEHVARLREAVTLIHDPTLDTAYPASLPARLSVTLLDGRILQASEDYPTGSPDKPMDADSHATKMKLLLGGAAADWQGYVAGLVRSGAPLSDPPRPEGH